MSTDDSKKDAAVQLYWSAHLMESVLKAVNFGPKTKAALLDTIRDNRKTAASLGYRDPYLY